VETKKNFFKQVKEGRGIVREDKEDHGEGKKGECNKRW
jgi:hypothetical protein